MRTKSFTCIDLKSSLSAKQAGFNENIGVGLDKPYFQEFNLSSLGDSPQNPTLFDLIMDE